MEPDDEPAAASASKVMETETGVRVDSDAEITPSDASHPKNRFEDRMARMMSERASQTSLKVVQDVSWWRQLQCCIMVKNKYLILRRPMLMTSMLFSSVASVLLAWAAGRDTGAPQAVLTPCGTIANDTLRYELESGYGYWGEDADTLPVRTLNEAWRNGVPVAILCLGPMVVAIGAFLFVTNEIQNQKLGILRQLGVKDSVYWMSWFLPLAGVSLLNSLLGAFTALWITNVHVYQSTSFGSMFASFWFLELALLPASFWLSAICGTTTRRGTGLAVWMLLVMMIAVWMPLLTLSIQDDATTNYGASTKPGLFWIYRNTTKVLQSFDFNSNRVNSNNSNNKNNNTNDGAVVDYYNLDIQNDDKYYGNLPDFDTNNIFNMDLTYTYSGCDEPLVSEAQARTPKTPTERLEFTASDEIFVGCYAEAGYATRIYNSVGASNGMVSFTLYLFPYFHFFSMWGNILGYTATAGATGDGDAYQKFGVKQASKSPQELSLLALASPPSMDHANITISTTGTSADSGQLFPQGSTVVTPTYSMYDEYEYDELEYYDLSGSYSSKNNCPPSDLEGYNFCPNLSNRCQYPATPAPSIASPSYLDSLGYLVSLMVIYSLLAAYMAQVCAPGNGASRKWYFFVQPSYWFPSSRSIMDTRIHNEANGTHTQDQAYAAAPSGSASVSSTSSKHNLKTRDEEHDSPSASTAGVQITNLRKRFGSLEAVKGVSLNMECGEVTALLGHNGAGKTTLSHMLACDFAPTEGNAIIFGHSVTDEPDAIRNLVGICQQDDYLWPDLSAKEHLELFGGLRGVPKTGVDATVQTWLESVDLADVQLQFSTTFSGGMKRRLSVALSTIGDRPFIILDEPTTGMDPVSRRFVWRHIDAIKKGRIVLLTTHAMEEADLLADAVAIMRKGELAAFGSPLELKAEHGSALQFSILVNKSEVKRAETNIRAQHFAYDQQYVSIEAGEAGNITVTIQKIRQPGGSSRSDKHVQEGVDSAVLSNFVAWLEDTAVSGVLEYGFSNSSLEEVFLKVTEEEDELGGAEVNDDEDMRDRVCCRCCFMGCIRCCLKSVCRCCCCPRPPAVMEEDLNLEEAQAGDEATSALNGGTRRPALASYQPELSILRQTETLLRNSFSRSWSGKGSTANYIMYGLMVIIVPLVGCVLDDYSFVPLMVLPTLFMSLMLVSLDVPIYSDRELGLFHLMRTQGLLKGSYLMGTSLYGFLVQLVFGVLMLSLFYAAPCFRDGRICLSGTGGQGDYGNSFCGWKEFGETMVLNPTDAGAYDVEVEGEKIRVDMYAVRSPGSYGMLIGTAFYFSVCIPGAIFSSTYLPGNKIAMTIVGFICLCAGVAPLILYITSFINWEEVLKCQQDICPLDRSLLDATGNQFLDCVGSMVNVQNMNSLCMPPHAAILPQFGLFQTLAMTTMSQIKFVTQPSGYEDEILAQLEVTSGCSGGSCVFPRAHLIYFTNLGYMLFGAVLLLVLGISLAVFADFPTGWVVALKHRMSHMWSRFLTRICCRGGLIVQDQGRDRTSTDNTNQELEEVIQERNAVCQMVAPFVQHREPEEVESALEMDELAITDRESIPRSDLPPVLMRKLRKVYPAMGGLPPKVALKSLDLHVPAGQVLGLLGKNGAGKTTALKILSGTHEASAGLGMVSGYDVTTERLDVFERLGNCPQFDVIWPGRTVEHHLLFFARLKGVPRSKIYDAALSIATAVGLGASAVYHRNAGDLSGGMRRRLSIAISLIGAPKVLLLDEPTTGLDPSTRNNIWSLINSFATEDRAMIITTHMMIEADTLCNRIAIVSRGELQVVATQQHLKNKFGSGYLLQLNLIKSSEEDQECAMRFVRTRLHPDAQKQNKQAKTLRISLPRDLNLQRVFEAMYSEARVSEGRINQFLLSQSSLEDVFLTLGE